MFITQNYGFIILYILHVLQCLATKSRGDKGESER